jgi:hypothetical protein
VAKNAVQIQGKWYKKGTEPNQNRKEPASGKGKTYTLKPAKKVDPDWPEVEERADEDAPPF